MNLWISNQSAVYKIDPAVLLSYYHWYESMDWQWVRSIQGWPRRQSHWVTTIDMNLWISNQSAVYKIDPANSLSELLPLIRIYGLAMSSQYTRLTLENCLRVRSSHSQHEELTLTAWGAHTHSVRSSRSQRLSPGWDLNLGSYNYIPSNLLRNHTIIYLYLVHYHKTAA